MHRLLAVCSLAVLLSSQARAADEVKGVVTVLPFDFRTSKADSGSRIVFEEAIRGAAAELLGPAGYNVLTGETQLQLLADNGVDLDKVCDTSCSLGAAREIKATFFITGVVSSSEGHHIAFVRLFRVKDGKMLRSQELEGKEIKDLRAAFRKESETFFSVVLGGTAPAKTATATPAPAPPPDTANLPGMTPSGHYKMNDAVVYDTKTRLTWQRRVPKKAYNEAPEQYCARLNLGGVSSWRLPKKDELLSIVETTEDGLAPTIDRAVFPETPKEWFWTASSEGIGDFQQTWKINFADAGSELTYLRGASATAGYVRCVR